MIVLVTGFYGYLGPHVVRLLKQHGHYVVGLDTGWFGPNYAEVPVYPDRADFEDIRDAWPRLNVDAVVHLAGLSNDPLGDLDTHLTHDINVDGTFGVVGHTTIPFRHVFASSCSVYGTAEMADEMTEPAPLTAYARAKAKVDGGTRDRGGVSLRFGTLYGYSPGHRLDLVVNRMTWDALHGLGIIVNGDAARPLTHVEDAARAIVAAVEGDLGTGIYNVVGENFRMQEVGRTVRDAIRQRLGTSPRLTFVPAGADARDYSASGAKLAATGFTFRHTLDNSLPDLIERTLWLPGSRGRYERLTAIKELLKRGHLGPDLRPVQEKAA